MVLVPASRVILLKQNGVSQQSLVAVEYPADTPSTPEPPAFTSEPGELADITVYNEPVNLGFVAASGSPLPAHVLSGTVPGGISVRVAGSPVSLPVSVARANVASISVIATERTEGEFALTLTASNGAAPTRLL